MPDSLKISLFSIDCLNRATLPNYMVISFMFGVIAPTPVKKLYPPSKKGPEKRSKETTFSVFNYMMKRVVTTTQIYAHKV